MSRDCARPAAPPRHAERLPCPRTRCTVNPCGSACRNRLGSLASDAGRAYVRKTADFRTCGWVMRVAIYLRVSTDGQTVENQRRELLAVAERHRWEIAGEFVDRGISGAKGRDNRPGLD